MSATKVYQLHNSLKLHFTHEDYDFHRFGLNAAKFNDESLSNKNDRAKYQIAWNKVAGMEDPDDKLKWIFISYFLLKPRMWIGDINEDFDRAMKFWRQRTKYKQNYVRGFIDDMDRVFASLSLSSQMRFGDIFVSNVAANGFVSVRVPKVVDMISSGTITPETAVILDMVYGYLNKADDVLAGNPIWSSISMRLKKFKSFLVITNQDLHAIKTYLKVKVKDLNDDFSA